MRRGEEGLRRCTGWRRCEGRGVRRGEEGCGYEGRGVRKGEEGWGRFED